MGTRSRLVFVSVLFATLLMLTGCSWRKQAQAQREARYQAALQSYSKTIKLGITRKELEEYLRAHTTQFGHICCIDESTAFATLVQIGEEHAPWYCEHHYVYIAFQFASTEPRQQPGIYDSDELKRLTVWHHFDACM